MLLSAIHSYRLPFIKSGKLFLWAFIMASAAMAQPVEQRVKVMVVPDRPDWTYAINDKARFNVSVLRDGHPIPQVAVRYEVGPEKVGPFRRDSAVLKTGTLTVEGGTLKTGGFIRCIVWARIDGKEYRGLATAGFAPLTIQPTIEKPADFNAFWDKVKTDLAKVPIDARMTLLPDRCTENVNVYHVNIQHFRPGTRLYGILCVPKKEDKYPALLKVPGAGVRGYAGDVAWSGGRVASLLRPSQSALQQHLRKERDSQVL